MTAQQFNDRNILSAEASLVAITHAQKERPYGPRNFAWEALLVEVVIASVREIIRRCQGEPSPDETRRMARALQSPPWWRFALRSERRRLEAIVSDKLVEAKKADEDPSALLGQILGRASWSTDDTILSCWRAAK